MASGRLGAAALATATNTTLYTVPAGKLATFNVAITNRSSTDTICARLALAASSSPSDAEWILYGYPVPPNATLERTGLVLDATKQVVGYASAAGLSFVIYGLED